MRQQLISPGANELNYEIRGIVKKAELLQQVGIEIFWENIGDPIQKNAQIPDWMKETLQRLLQSDHTYGYCHSKGELETRKFLMDRTNALNGVQITTNDILFFNGLGDAIAKLYQYLPSTSRVIGPSPAYSTHSSAEAAHAHHEPLTYKLDPDNNWYPDIEDLYNKVKYNPNIVGLIIINPDNPTGMVYPMDVLKKMVAIAKEFDLFIISDEIYSNITYNGAHAYKLSEFIGEVPGVALKGISKEFPWPGSRCGWMEFYNRDVDKQFDAFCKVLDDAKMIEVCSTKLPQVAIPKIMSDPRYKSYREEKNKEIGRRSKLIASILGGIPELKFNETYGAFYNTIIFKDGVLKPHQKLSIANEEAAKLMNKWLVEERQDMPLDKQFVYYLLAAKGICVVPTTSFCSDLQGFRVTLLEENEERLIHIFTSIKEAVIEYLAS